MATRSMKASPAATRDATTSPASGSGQGPQPVSLSSGSRLDDQMAQMSPSSGQAEPPKANSRMGFVWQLAQHTKAVGLPAGSADEAWSAAQSRGLVTGDDRTTTVNRAVAAKMTLDGLGKSGSPAPSAVIKFDDVGGEWFDSWAHQARRWGVVDGFPDNTFRPGDDLAAPHATALAKKAATAKERPITTQAKSLAPEVKQRVLADQPRVPRPQQEDAAEGQRSEEGFASPEEGKLAEQDAELMEQVEDWEKVGKRIFRDLKFLATKFGVLADHPVLKKNAGIASKYWKAFDAFVVGINDIEDVWSSDKPLEQKIMGTYAVTASTVINTAIGTLTSAVYAISDIVAGTDWFFQQLEKNAPLLGTGAWMMPGGIQAQVDKIDAYVPRDDWMATDALQWATGVIDSSKTWVSDQLMVLSEGELEIASWGGGS